MMRKVMMFNSPINNTILAISEELTCYLNENPHLEDTVVCHQFGFRESVMSYVFSHLFPLDGNSCEKSRSLDAMSYCNDSTFRKKIRDQIIQFISQSNA